jgi:hypothetical protein
MPHLDQIVLALILAGLVASVVDHWRAGQRGWRLAALTFVSLFGIGLVTMMAGHCADIIYNLARVYVNRSLALAVHIQLADVLAVAVRRSADRPRHALPPRGPTPRQADDAARRDLLVAQA